MNTVFVNASNVVVQIIVGELDASQQVVFLRDYAILFGATALVTTDRSVWIGGTYNPTDNTFTTPTPPEVIE
jgi:hypothetical protein